MTISEMKDYIHEVYPKWNLEKFDEGKIMAIYFSLKNRRTK